MARGRQYDLAAQWGLGQPAVSLALKRMKEGKRLNKVNWTRWAGFYIDCLSVMAEVKKYENSTL